jgi:hypothetical protein
MSDKASMAIPIRFVGPDGDELSLGDYLALRKDACLQYERILAKAREVHVAYDGAQSGVERASDILYDSIRKLKGELEALDRLRPAPLVGPPCRDCAGTSLTL